MSDESESQRDWSDLPQELLHLISKKLPDLRDFIRFRAVCPSWCSSTPLSDPPPQLPWILDCPLDKFEYVTSLQEELRFYSLSTSEIGVIRVKKSSQGMASLGPSCGYLLLREVGSQSIVKISNRPEQVSRVFLFNPLTNVDISLPQLPYSNIYIVPVWTGTDPAESRTVIFTDVGPRIGSWFIYQTGMTKCIRMNKYPCSICYWDGMIFADKGNQDTQVYDIISQKLLYEISVPEYRYVRNDDDGTALQSYVVELSGIIVRVSWYFGPYKKVEESYFKIYELKFVGKNKEPCWVKVSNIGNHILFLDQYNGFSLKPIAGFKGNCIYMFGYHHDTPCRYDIAAATFEKLPCPFKYCTWFFPSLL